MFESNSDRTDTRSFEVSGDPLLIVDNFNGRVEIVGGGAEGEVRVEAELRSPDAVDYSVEQDGDTIRVEARPRRSRSILGWMRWNRGAHIRISAPTRSRADVSNSNGRVTARRLAGGGSLRTSNGRILAVDLQGDYTLDTSNGRIEALGAEGKFDLDTSNGRVNISGASGQYRVATSNGRIEFEGNLEAGGDNRFATSNGSIRVALRGDVDLRVSASTSNGSIDCSHPIDADGATRPRPTRHARRLEGVIGGGAAALALRTSNASITIE